MAFSCGGIRCTLAFQVRHFQTTVLVHWGVGAWLTFSISGRSVSRTGGSASAGVQSCVGDGLLVARGRAVVGVHHGLGLGALQ
eukprot:13834260-Alexandrium_andersonii.AAC.1